jgi:hypothetical protein
MNPDQNTEPAQPEQPEQPEQPAQGVPQTPVESPETPVIPVEQPAPAPEGSAFGASAFSAPSAPAEPVAANLFGAAPVVSSENPAQPTVIGSSPNSDPLPNPAKKSKKKLIILLSAIVGALIILGAAAIAVYLIFFNVTHDDYQKAYTQATTVQEKLSTDAGISSDTSKESIDSAKTAYADFKTENAKLADLKAIKVDKDIHAKYVTYDAKAKSFISFMDGFLPSYEKFAGVTDQISALSADNSTSSFTSANVQKTIDLLKSADDITDPTLKTFLDTAISVYTEVLPQAKIYETSSSTSSQKLAAISAISDSYDKLSTASSKMSDDLDAKIKDVDPTDSLNALGQTITDKLNKTK